MKSESLTVSTSRDGGFGYFPGLAEPVTVRAAELPPEDADRLARAVVESGFFELPDPPGAGQAPDRRTYTITVSEGDHRRTLTAPEPLPNGLRDIVEIVEAHR